MPPSLEADIATLASLGGDAAHERYDEFAGCLARLLHAEPQAITDIGPYHAALCQGFAYFYWKWDRRGAGLYAAVTAAIGRWDAATPPRIGLLCDLVDFIYFLVWCFDDSSTRQCERLMRPLRVASLSFARSAPRREWPLPARNGPYRVAWLGMYVQSDSPITIALHAAAPALRASGHQLDVYAWRFTDDASRACLKAAGARVHECSAATPLETILAIEARAERDRPDIVVSDMNNGVPTAVFSRRLAPVQILLQGGMPAWPVRHLDAVFNSFGFDPRRAGWGRAVMLRFDSPWDAAALAPPVAEADIAAERALLPGNTRLVGSYGRFAKITRPYLRAVEQILLRCPDVGFVLGGTGDAAHVRSFIADSPAGARMTLQERYVAGHVWGHILDLLLDTWPVTGGISAREMLAKSKPVVTRHSAEMPAMDRQRDPELVARDWDGFVDKAVHLLRDKAAYAAACARAGALVRRLSDISTFNAELDTDLRRAVRGARFARSAIGRMVGGLRDVLHPGDA